MSLKKIVENCSAELEELARSRNAGNGKELPPLKDESSSETAGAVSNPYDYHTAFSEICQAGNKSLIACLENWIEEFIAEIYNNQSEDWQHGFDMGEKLSELRRVIQTAKGESV